MGKRFVFTNENGGDFFGVKQNTCKTQERINYRRVRVSIFVFLNNLGNSW